MPKRAVIVLADGFEEIEAITVIDVLHRAGVQVVVAGVGGNVIQGAHDVTVNADITLENLQGIPDAVILPGGMPGAENLAESDAVQGLVSEVNEEGGICAAICAAPALTLGPWGVLAGKRATCYPGFESRLPAESQFSQDRVVVDGNVITSRAPGTAMEFALTLVERLADAATANELRAGMLVA